MYFIFKIIRKISFWIHDLHRRYRIVFLYYLSQKNIVINSDIIFGKNFQVHTEVSKTKVLIGEKARIRDNFRIYVGEHGSIVIGANNFFNNNCSINCLGKITIGNDCQLGENVLLYDHNHSYKDDRKLISEQGYDVGEIAIGNNCWIGSGVIILKDVIIGDNVVIGAGCVIYRSVESGSVIYNEQRLINRIFKT